MTAEFSPLYALIRANDGPSWEDGVTLLRDRL